jgi:hypothetical protein
MDPTYLKLLEYAAFGSVGAIVGAMAKCRKVQLPRVSVERTRDGETVTVIDMGFLTAPLLGACLAMYFDTNAPNAIAWGLAAGFVGPSLLNSMIDPLLKRLGFDPDAPAVAVIPARPERQP